MACSKRLNDEVWKGIEKRNDKEKRRFLEWHLQAREPIKKFSEMRKGDHLVKKKSIGGKVLYYHHFLCIGFHGEDKPRIIHYFNTAANAFDRLLKTGSYGSGSAFGKLGIVQELRLPHKDFIASESELQEKGAEVERVVWPEELKRYSVDEVIERARKRINEKRYDLAKNNCESFVMRCLCDNDISLQSTTSVLALKEIACGIAMTFFRGLQQVPKIVAEIIEKVLGRTVFGNPINEVGIEGISALGSIFGVVLTLVVEIGYAAYNIYKAKQKWNKDTLSKEEFSKEVVDAVVLSSSRAAGCIGGMFFGQIIIPIPFVGGFIGLLIGTFTGHLVGTGISETCSEALASVANELIDYLRNFWHTLSQKLVHCTIPEIAPAQ